MPSTRLGASYSPSSSSQKVSRRDYGRSHSVTEGKGSVNKTQTDKLFHSVADNNVLPSKRAETSTRSLSGHLKSQPGGLQQCTAPQRVSNHCRSVEKLHELLPDYEKLSGPSQHLEVTQWMASIDGKEKYDAFNSRMEEKEPTNTQVGLETSPSSHKQKLKHEKETKSPEKGQGQRTSHKTLQLGLQNPKVSTGWHGKCVSDGKSNYAITEKGVSQITI
ncbi:hypothetical protein O181_050518 [Austropuccinia psidii MF-1]|uniref:Uncharacterized protein n=1 Tax=Austropuccinia psidii MF-1 TaxID=1389203 RepID=A0A9Q3HMF7_9BASI|nr:hypothetical protein [Austropuccinia psidii MF-1]